MRSHTRKRRIHEEETRVCSKRLREYGRIKNPQQGPEAPMRSAGHTKEEVTQRIASLGEEAVTQAERPPRPRAE